MTTERSDSAPDESAMLFGFWYRALASDRLGPGCKTKVSFPDAAVLVGRDRAGRPFALRDACPHRGMPLSYGWFDGDSVQCRYHGWTFDVHTGQCRRIPSLLPSQESTVAKIYAGHMPCEERDGFVWVFLPEGKGKGCGPTAEAPALAPPTMPIFSKKHRFVQLSSEVPTSADHGLTSLLDPVHGPFVHRRWWWIVRALFGIADDGDSLVEIERQFVPLPLGFRETSSAPITSRLLRKYTGAKTMDMVVDFVLPNIRLGTIHAGKYWSSILVTVTAITPTSCRIELSMAWNAFQWLWPGESLMKALFQVFTVQDRNAMARQSEGLAGAPRLMFIDDADRPSLWYYQMKRAYLQSQRTGLPFAHPLREPTTLKWRHPNAGDVLGR